ncbi:MAG TPA: restriction endonuclease [Ktedonobacteraceae bacterium]|nr:restriction endonuclease [Ktedonobacteraceae bacterium]
MPESTPPLHPDMKREMKRHLLALSARGFELFAGELLVYVGLEAVSVTRYIGDGGIDALGNLVAGHFHIPLGIQVKRYRKNIQRPDIDKFVGALSGRFSQGLFLTTADYTPAALQKAATSVPRVLTMNGDQVVSLMVEHQLGVKPSSLPMHKLDIDPDYFATFEAMRGLFDKRVKEDAQLYATPPSALGLEERTIELLPEQDLLSLNAFSYALRVDPARVRRWVENGALHPDASQLSSGRTICYFRRDRVEQVRRERGLETIPTSTEEWKQEFLDFAKSRNLSRSYKPVMLKTLFSLVDREGKAHLDDLAKAFRAYYIQQLEAGEPLEEDNSLMARPSEASDQAVKQLIRENPLERFRIKNFLTYVPEEDILQIAPQLWQALFHYEVKDVLNSVDEQIQYYLLRQRKKKLPEGLP